MSGQAQKRLKQYLVDVSLIAIAEYNSDTKGTAFSQELGELYYSHYSRIYYSRMLRGIGIKQYDAQLAKLLEDSNPKEEEEEEEEEVALATA